MGHGNGLVLQEGVHYETFLSYEKLIANPISIASSQSEYIFDEYRTVPTPHEKKTIVHFIEIDTQGQIYWHH